jgi:hypothetical protein
LPLILDLRGDQQLAIAVANHLLRLLCDRVRNPP